MKHSIIALDAGIAPETLSRILTAQHGSPSFRTVVNIVHATGHTVGWLLDEPGYSFAPDEVKELRRAAAIISATTDRGESLSAGGQGFIAGISGVSMQPAILDNNTAVVLHPAPRDGDVVCVSRRHGEIFAKVFLTESLKTEGPSEAFGRTGVIEWPDEEGDNTPRKVRYGDLQDQILRRTFDAVERAIGEAFVRIAADVVEREHGRNRRR